MKKEIEIKFFEDIGFTTLPVDAHEAAAVELKRCVREFANGAYILGL